MRIDPSYLPVVGAFFGAGVAALVVRFGNVGSLSALVVLAGIVGGGFSAAGLHQLLSRGPLCPVPGEVLALPEVDAAYRQGYAIVYRQGRPNRGRERWVFHLLREGRRSGYLETDFMPVKHWLFIENIYVDDRHGKRGLGTALLLCAAKTTGCRVMTTSARTHSGIGFFAKNDTILAKYGVQMLD